MSDVERTIHDYLDGRLSAEERTAFERRLAEDEELALRCAEFAEFGEALREGEDQVSPGFHTRAKAAFEEHRAPRRRFPVSWEALGLAAAVLVAAVVFVPPMLRDESPLEEVFAPPLADDDQPAKQVGALGEAEATDSTAADAVDSFKAKKESESQGRIRQQEKPAPPPEPLAETVEPTATPTAAAPEQKRAAAAPRRERMAADAGADAGVEMELAEDTLGGTAYRAAPATCALPGGALPPGEWLVVEDDAAWTNLMSTPAGPALATLRGGRRDVRVVLVGPRTPPWSCDASRITLEGDFWRVVAARGHDADGCAFLVPDDGVPIAEPGP